jgi:hypothetical protein
MQIRKEVADGGWIRKEEPCGGRIYDKEANDGACGQETGGSARWSMAGVAVLMGRGQGYDAAIVERAEGESKIS